MDSLNRNTPIEDAKEYMLPYLTHPDQEALLRELAKKYPDVDYYRLSSPEGEEILQGDGWKNFEIVDFHAMKKINISGIILSNTCDIELNNCRYSPPNINFASITSAKAYQNVLLKEMDDEKRIESHMDAIRRQSVSNRFYFPRALDMKEDYIALLDDIHSIPRDYYLKCADRKLYIRLSNAGFYIFILKLSIHFCRFGDKVNRDKIIMDSCVTKTKS